MLHPNNTTPSNLGFRLQYMEVYNWGTFNQRIFSIKPDGQNSLMTGANASGKSSYIDALLTLLVPVKKDRFYNQSSGVDKKGDRTEESYVTGNYGHISNEGEYSLATQSLRSKSSYSIILANFVNPEQLPITLFQVRWFVNGQMKRSFGIAHKDLHIEKNFAQFDAKEAWKKKLEKEFNSGTYHQIEFYNGPVAYADRLCKLLGMLSTKALTLFNHIVGVKVLEDLNDFIRINMLEQHDSEKEYRILMDSFVTLMDAKTNIEKAEEQMKRLAPICNYANQLSEYKQKKIQFTNLKETGVYWFAQRTVELCTKEIGNSKQRVENFEEEKEIILRKEKELKGEESEIRVEIERDEVGVKIKHLEEQIDELETISEKRLKNLDRYNGLVRSLAMQENPDKESFVQNKKQAFVKIEQNASTQETEIERNRQIQNQLENIDQKIRETAEDIEVLKENKNNISKKVASIRENILLEVGASKEEIPFVGELVQVKAEEEEWEAGIEKLLHNFALRIIVPQRYYEQVNRYINNTNLGGRIVYQLYKPSNHFTQNRQNHTQHRVENKLEFRTQSEYYHWVHSEIQNRYNYTCVENLREFNQVPELALTKEGLLKHRQGRHEKDDRKQLAHRASYVLGWDNREKIEHIKNDLFLLSKEKENLLSKKNKFDIHLKQLNQKHNKYIELHSSFETFNEIDWQSSSKQILSKREDKNLLESTSNRIKELQNQFAVVKKKLIEVDTEKNTINRALFGEEEKEKQLQTLQSDNKELLERLGEVDCSFMESKKEDLLVFQLTELPKAQKEFQKENEQQLSKISRTIQNIEDSVKVKINDFKRPPETILELYKEWRSDVHHLPEAINLDFIGEYQNYLEKLKVEDLPRYKNKFNQYLQETILHKIGGFNMFFNNWADSIRENINHLNQSLHEIDFNDNEYTTYIQIIAKKTQKDEIIEFNHLIENALGSLYSTESDLEARKAHFEKHIVPLITTLSDEKWRTRVMNVRSWFNYKAEEFTKIDNNKVRTYENMGQLSGGEKAQLTYTILGSAIAYQFGLTKEGNENSSFRFIAIDEAFKSQDEDKARYLLKLCNQLKLQLLVVTPLDNIHIVEDEIAHVHFIERKEDKSSWLYDMPIVQFREEREKFLDYSQ